MAAAPMRAGAAVWIGAMLPDWPPPLPPLPPPLPPLPPPLPPLPPLLPPAVTPVSMCNEKSPRGG